MRAVIKELKKIVPNALGNWVFFCFRFYNIPPVIYWNDNVNTMDASVL